MVEALLFDLDGTLVDTDPVHYQTWKDMLQDYGVQINPSIYKTKFSGRLNPDIVKDLFPHFSPEQVSAFSDRKEAEFRRRATALQPLAGVLDLLNWVEQHHLKKAVVTNAPLANAEFMLRSLGLATTFPVVILGEETAAPKPDPAPYQAALKRLEVEADAAIAFEDSPSGLRSAVAAGIPTVGLATTQAPEALYDLGAFLVVTDFTDPRLLEYFHIPAFLSIS
jgi:HAD superfamily hydrolase (TIGR01509 family)